MRLRLGLTTSTTAGSALWIASEADKRGLKGVLIGEDLGRRQDVFTLTSFLLTRTERIEVGIGITSPLYHNITTIGRASALLHRIAPGRFTLGIGIGGLHDLAREGIQVKSPREALRNAVKVLRDLWAGKTLHYTTRQYSLKDYIFPKVEGRIPLNFGVRGPRLLRLSAELANGVIISGSKSYLRETVKVLEEALEAHNRRRREFTIIAWTPTLITTSKRDRDAAKRIVATILGDTPMEALHQLPLYQEVIHQVKSSIRKGRTTDALRLIDDSLMEEFCIYGDVSEVTDKLRSLEKLGVDEAVFGPPYGTPNKTAIKEVAKEWMCQ